MKKIVSLLLAVMLLVSVPVTVFAQDEVPPRDAGSGSDVIVEFYDDDVMTPASFTEPMANATADVPITKANFPDTKFRNTVLSQIDRNKDKLLNAREANALKSIIFTGWNTKTLKGIKLFPNLDYLSVRNNKLTSLDVSGMNKLTYLSCYQNNMKTLNVTGCTKLKTLYADDNKLTALNLFTNTKIVNLDLSGNKLKALSVAKLKPLKNLDVANNQLVVLQLGSLKKLENVYASNNRLYRLNTSGCTNLKYLGLSGNQFRSLDLSKNKKLTSSYSGSQEMTAQINLNAATGVATFDLKSFLGKNFSYITATPSGYGFSYTARPVYNPTTGLITMTGITAANLSEKSFYVTCKAGSSNAPTMNITINLTAAPIKTASAAISLSAVTLKRGKNVTLIAYSYPEVPANTITWKSNKPKIATVNKSGKVVAKAKGKATITATVNGKKVKCVVTVQ